MVKKLLLAAVALLVASAAFAQSTTLFDGKKTFDFKSINFNPTTGGLVGTTAGDDATAGIAGELLSTTVAVGSHVSLSTGTSANMTSVALTAGDWDVTCQLVHELAASTTVTVLSGSISATSATMTTIGLTDSAFWRQASAAAGGSVTQLIGPHRVSIAAGATYYCVANDAFGTSTDFAYGVMRARRVR